MHEARDREWERNREKVIQQKNVEVAGVGMNMSMREFAQGQRHPSGSR